MIYFQTCKYSQNVSVSKTSLIFVCLIWSSKVFCLFTARLPEWVYWQCMAVYGIPFVIPFRHPLSAKMPGVSLHFVLATWPQMSKIPLVSTKKPWTSRLLLQNLSSTLILDDKLWMVKRYHFGNTKSSDCTRTSGWLPVKSNFFDWPEFEDIQTTMNTSQLDYRQCHQNGG